MLYIMAVICIILMVLSLFLLFLGLPGNWLILGITALWAFFTGSPEFGWQFFALLVCLAGSGEVIEFIAGYFGTKKYGGSGKGSVGGMIGALVGGILCAPLFFGFGALLGALAGGFAGCWLVEIMCGAGNAAALRAAFGATLGRFGGFIVKLGIGIGMIWLVTPRLWAGIGIVS